MRCCCPPASPLLSALIFSLTVPHFADLRNILNIFEQLGVLGFLAIGMTFVMVAGGIDLSCYTVVSAAAVVGATAMVDTESGAARLFADAAGRPRFRCTANGIAIAYGRMIPFIVTLSTMVLAQGFAIWYTQAQSVYGLPDDYIDLISGRLFGVIPMPAMLILVVALVTGLILARTQYGRWVYLTGANEQTARVSGIDIRLTKFSTYVLSGLMAGVTAIVLTAIVGASTTSMVRDERLMDVIAATVIGGASLKGGSGSVVGTMFGLSVHHHPRQCLQPARRLPFHRDGDQRPGAGGRDRPRRAAVEIERWRNALKNFGCPASASRSPASRRWTTSRWSVMRGK